MATAPRRETMIALRARRTSHQVATAVYLHEHVRQLITRCTSCGNEFVPTEAGQERCPQCMPKTSRSRPNNIADDAPPPPRRRISSALLKIHDALISRDIDPSDAERVIAIFAIIAAFIAFAVLVFDPTRH